MMMMMIDIIELLSLAYAAIGSAIPLTLPVMMCKILFHNVGTNTTSLCRDGATKPKKKENPSIWILYLGWTRVGP